MLCKNCENYQSVEAKETGTMLEFCSAFRRPITHFGQVTRCTDYSAKDLPYVFTREAWQINVDGGKPEFVDPRGEKWVRTKDGSGMRKVKRLRDGGVYSR